MEPCINPDKVKIIPFAGKHKLDHLRAIRQHGMKVKQETEVKYFEITLGQKLLCKMNLENIYPKTTRALIAFRSIAEKTGIHFENTALDILHMEWQSE